MIYKVPATYDFGMTLYRNFYNSKIMGAVTGAHSGKVLQEHLRHAPTWNTYNQEEVIVVTDPGGADETTTITYENILTEPRVCHGAIDIDAWIKSEINDDEIECNVSFICSLVHQTGLMSQEDLDVFIDHKVNYVRKTERGKAMVSQYHKLGSIMQRRMETDLYRHDVYKHIHDTWIANVVECIKKEEFDKAELLYFEMLTYLAERYKLERYLHDFPK